MSTAFARKGVVTAALFTSTLLFASACSSNSSSGGSNAGAAPASSGSSSSSSSSGGSVPKGQKLAFLMPDQGSTRYEEHDKPGFVSRVKELCPDCAVLYQNATADASKQQQQFNSVLTQGAKVIVLDAVDTSAAASLVSAAKAKGVKVIAYDRPITSGADFYVSYDNEKIGATISSSLGDALKAKKVSPDGGNGVLEVNGSPTDAAAGLIKKGMHTGITASGYKTLAEYDTPDWDPSKAQAWVSGQITRFRGKIVGVVAANDGTGGGAIAAFKAAGVTPVPPVSGNDAITAALQLIISGDQYNTISKPSEIVAGAAADAAVAFLKGQTPASDTKLFNTPTKLFTPALVTQANLKAEIIDKNINKASELCTGAYAAGCAKLGIS